jgi:hypothetical protein
VPLSLARRLHSHQPLRLTNCAAPVLLQAKLAPKLAQLKALEQKQALLGQGLAQYAENDPERINMLSEPWISCNWVRASVPWTVPCTR